MVFWSKSDGKAEEDDTLDKIIPNHHDEILLHENTGDTAELLNDQVLDVIIIGAGWAGISAGMYVG